MCTVSSVLTVPGYSYVTEIQPHTHFSMTYVDRVERNQTTRSSVRGLFLLYQLPRIVAQAGPGQRLAHDSQWHSGLQTAALAHLDA